MATNSHRQPKVLLTSLSIRRSAKGNEYLSGYLGKSQIVGFPGEPDKFGNETWDIYVTTPAPREGSSGAAQPRTRGTSA